MSDGLALPFDQYQRYRLVADLIEEVRPKKGARFEILDVGGRTALLRTFLPRDRIALVDLEASEQPGLVLGDGSALPFADASFDVVCAFDTLEHVPTGRRAAFVAECRRVARSYVVIAGPYAAPEVVEAEAILRVFLKDKLAVEHRYLDEHSHHGLPARATVEAQLAGQGAQVASIGHGSLERWLPLMCLSMYMDYVPELRAIAGRFHRFYNKNLYESDHGEPVYRHAVVAAIAGAALPRGVSLASSSAAPRRALPEIADLAYDVIAFDRARQYWAGERSRLVQVVDDLRTDLEGHKRTLAEVVALRAQQEQVLATLASDLEGHRRTKADLERDSRIAREEFETTLAQHRQVIQGLEEDLAGHRQALAEVGAEAEARAEELAVVLSLRDKELAEWTAVRGELERLLDEHKAVVATHEQDLAGHRKALSDLGREVQAVRAELDRVRAELALTARTRADEAAEARQVIATLEHDLDEHKAVVATYARDLAGHRELVTTLRAESTVQRQDLERTMDERNNTRLALEDVRAQLVDAARVLREKEALIESLRMDLRSRWKSLRRALGPKGRMPGD